jgi:hypothetical protein
MTLFLAKKRAKFGHSLSFVRVSVSTSVLLDPELGSNLTSRFTQPLVFEGGHYRYPLQSA